MRIFAVADLHNRLDRVTLIKNTIEQHRPGIVVIAGDITSYFRKISVLSELNKLQVKVLIVRGNSDLKKVDKMVENYSNIESLHFNSVKTEGFQFLGLNGTVPLPFNSKICLNEGRLLKELSLKVGRKTILVAHPPPRGILDKVMGRFHAGCRSLNQFLAQTRPILYLCGHIHEDPGVSYIGKTAVVNCSIGGRGHGSLIEIGESGVCDIRML